MLAYILPQPPSLDEEEAPTDIEEAEEAEEEEGDERFDGEDVPVETDAHEVGTQTEEQEGIASETSVEAEPAGAQPKRRATSKRPASSME